MKDCYLGVDIGSISTKGVIIDENNNIITKAYIWTEGNPTKAVKKTFRNFKKRTYQKTIKLKVLEQQEVQES